MEGTTRRFERTGKDGATIAGDERSVGELVQQLSQQTSALIRQEMRLAQAELTEKGKHAGKGAGMFGGAGLVALYGVGALVAAAIVGLGTLIEPWIAAVIVGAVLLAVAGILALTGKKQVEQATPPKPEKTLESVQRDVDTVKARAKS
jgi:MFS family permease